MAKRTEEIEGRKNIKSARSVRTVSSMQVKTDLVTASFGIKSSVVSVQSKKPEIHKVDVSRISIGTMVSHAKFGRGQVIELGGGYLTVHFAQGEKRFQFPDAFEYGFLKEIKE